MTEAVKETFVVSRNTYNRLIGIDKMLDRILVREELPDNQVYIYKFPYLYRILYITELERIIALLELITLQ